jgi:NADH dehydrogenase
MGLMFGAAFRYIWPLSSGILGGPPITGNQVELLKSDNVVSEGALTLADIGVTEIESIEAIVPSYLYRFRPYGQYHQKSEV